MKYTISTHIREKKKEGMKLSHQNKRSIMESSQL